MYSGAVKTPAARTVFGYVFCSSNWKGTMYTLLLNLSLYACQSTAKNSVDTADIGNESSLCPTGIYSAILQVWNDDEGDNLVDTPPFCEAPFDIEIQDDGTLYSAGDCEFERGQQTRTLSYVFQGEPDESERYLGEVSLARQNGMETTASFSGSCTQTESNVDIRIDWNMSVTTPNGERLHIGVLSTED